MEPSDYRVPKRKVQARLHLVGMAPREIEIFLGEVAADHAGPERPSDLLSGRERFLAARDVEDGFVLVHVDAVVALRVAADVELFAEALPPEDLAGDLSVTRRVEVMLTDGETVRGTVSYLQPAGQQRVRDFFNQAGPCVVVRDDAEAWVVRTARIARVRALDES